MIHGNPRFSIYNRYGAESVFIWDFKSIIFIFNCLSSILVWWSSTCFKKIIRNFHSSSFVKVFYWKRKFFDFLILKIDQFLIPFFILSSAIF